MHGHDFPLADATLTALGSGALFWRAESLLCVSDLHLGKAERIARRGGALLPPFETRDTLARLADDIASTDPAVVVCLGDSFDDLAAAGGLGEAERSWLMQLMAGRRWIWVEGNHDPGPVDLGGTHRAELALGPLVFRHIARPDAAGEVSGHYHPKARLARRSRPAFLVDSRRVILPAYGTYTGGLACHAPPLAGLMGPQAIAILTGAPPRAMPMPRR
ncbi:ligase-associated DNA damage response endonuclease PdeM [Rhodovulum sp. YNF3179]|uniref:ligase-associated DNA damage response endonuclease PdeM n=1 Tax=Rhodovulum sp. YNF3179 TaxID=3425127 RepID=UPI003D34B973